MKKFVFFLCLIITIFAFPVINNLETFNAYANQESTTDVVPVSDDLFIINQYLDKHCVLTKDISINAHMPLGIIDNAQAKNFTGVLDGDGHSITIKIEDTNKFAGYGLFYKLNGATIKNLNLKLEIAEDVIYSYVENVLSINIGGIAGEIVSSNLQECSVEVKVVKPEVEEQPLGEPTQPIEIKTIKNSLYFGGIGGIASSGTTIKNCSSLLDVGTIEKDINQGINLAVGGFVGSLNNSKIFNSYAQSNVCVSTQEDSTNIAINVGGITGYLEGANAEIISVYSDINLTSTYTYNYGLLVGKVDTSLAPNAGNLNYIYGCGDYKINGYTQVFEYFGINTNYSINDLHFSELEENDYSVFSIPSNFAQSPWDFNTVWSENNDGFPSLQQFKIYNIKLNVNPNIDYGGLTPTGTVTTASIYDVEENENVGEQFIANYGTEVEVRIEISETFSKYFYLDSIKISERTIYDSNNSYANDPMFTVTKPSEDLTLADAVKYYSLKYSINDLTKGEISFSLDKKEYELEIATDNVNMGYVRNQFSSVKTDKFNQKLLYGNTYNFYAEPYSNDFAFLNWAFVYEDEESLLTEQTSNFSFVFGGSDFDEAILKGGKLTSYWTSNVCKVNLDIATKDGISVSGCEIVDENGNALPKEISRSKGGEITLNVKVSEDYIFDGWYDSTGRLLGNNTTLNLTLDQALENYGIVAKVIPYEKQTSLLWLWITIGVTCGLAVIGFLVFIIIKKSRNKGYKNFY